MKPSDQPSGEQDSGLKPTATLHPSDGTAATLRLKPGRHFPFLARHPWVHAHALAQDGRDLQQGQVVDLIDHDGNWVARGAVNPASRLRVRLYSFDRGIHLDDSLIAERLGQSIQRRRLLQPYDPQGAERLFFSESDLLSGLIVDRYGEFLGVQFTSAALLKWKEPIVERLGQLLPARGIVVRVDEKTAKHEGIDAILETFGQPVPPAVCYHQNGLKRSVDLVGGQKTGGYLDQRINQKIAAGYLRERRVLDMCCYHGGFGLTAAATGAQSVLGVDTSSVALDSAKMAAKENNIENVSFEQGDCFDWLKQASKRGDRFDAVVLDPPRFAGSRHQIDSAIRAYRRINASALDLLDSGGILVTCSCSGRVSRSDFLNMLLDVGRRKRRDLVMLENRGPAPDHPVAISCPESDYLKCVILQVM